MTILLLKNDDLCDSIVHDMVFDIFFLSHFLGWFCLMIIFRNW